jgi:hypothetical protein
MSTPRHTEAERPISEKTPAGVPKASKYASTEEKVGVGIGAIAGGAVGAMAGPIGMAVGASLGAVVGEVAGEALHQGAVAKAKHEHDLDEAGPAPPRGVTAPESDASFLRADHELLETLAEDILQTVTEGDREDISEAVSLLQTTLFAHLEGEERELLPRYASEAPEDAALILKDHAAIRKQLAELDLQTDLHLVRAEAMRAFLVALRAHAARENAGLYRWAARSLDPMET